MAEHVPVQLHIGFHKTGTTYLQHLLWRNRVFFRSRFVLRGRTQPLGQEIIRLSTAMARAEGAAKTAVAEDLAAVVADRVPRLLDRGRSLLLSNEEIPGIHLGRPGADVPYRDAPRLLGAWCKALGPERIRFLVYTRDTTRWLYSVYDQAVRTARMREEFDAFSAGIETGFTLDRLLESWRMVLPEARFVTYRMEEDLVHHWPGYALLRDLGFSTEELAALDLPTGRNESLDAAGRAQLLDLNRSTLDGPAYRAAKTALLAELRGAR